VSVRLFNALAINGRDGWLMSWNLLDEPHRSAALIEAASGPFEPEKIPDKYAETLRELLQAKVEQRAPQIEVVT
jgi:hypothetical protein